MIPVAKRKRLKRILLKIDGDDVLFPPEDPDINFIIKYGYLFIPELKVSYRKMTMFDCHGNSSKIFLEDPNRYFICLGYALDPEDSEEMLWRSHTWVFDDKKNKIIETTESRSLYFGSGLTKEASLEFAVKEANYYDS